MDPALIQRAYAAFQQETNQPPPMTLRAGDAVDSYDIPPPYDPELDQPTDAYLQQFTYWGLIYLDPLSWRHYLPRLMDYSLCHATSDASPKSGLVVEGTLNSLCPAIAQPSRFEGLTPEQEATIVAFLDRLAFDDRSDYQEEAMQVLEDCWLP